LGGRGRGGRPALVQWAGRFRSITVVRSSCAMAAGPESGARPTRLVRLSATLARRESGSVRPEPTLISEGQDFTRQREALQFLRNVSVCSNSCFPNRACPG